MKTALLAALLAVAQSAFAAKIVSRTKSDEPAASDAADAERQALQRASAAAEAAASDPDARPGVDYQAEANEVANAAASGDIASIKRIFNEHPELLRRPEWRTMYAHSMAVAGAMGHPEVAAFISELKPAAARSRARPGNLDNDAYDRMRASAGLAPEKKSPGLQSDVDTPSEKGKPRPDDFALVIGVEEYQSLPKAEFGARDAETVRKHLEALGVPARNIIALAGPAATGNKIKSYLEEWLPLNVKPTSTLWIYYSGHGAPDPKTGQAYLVPWDGDPQFLKSTAYPLKKLYSDLAKTKAKRVIVALDACFSGAGGRSVLAKGARPLVTKVETGASADPRLTVLAAASGDQITGTLDEQGHGMFTYFFLKGLAEGKASAKELFDYLSPKVQDEARRQNREQSPALIGADAAF